MKVIFFALLALLAVSRTALAEGEFERMTAELFAHPELGEDLTFMSQYRRAGMQKGAISVIPAEMQRDIDREIRAHEARQSANRSRSPALDSDSPAVVRRIKAEGGMPFPSTTPPPLEVEAVKAEVDDFVRRSEELSKRLAREMPQTEAAPELPECDADKTVRAALPQDDQEAQLFVEKTNSNLVLDMLFLAEAPPVDAQEIFGRRARVIHYQPGTQDAVSLLAARSGVICLPYRVRMTAKHLFWDVGKNALRNYDKNPEGKGEMHEYLKIKEEALKGDIERSKKKGKKHESS